MKKVISIIVLFLISSAIAQERDSTYSGVLTIEDHAFYRPPTCFVIGNLKFQELRLDFGGDSLKVYGDLPYDEGAKLFLEHMVEIYQMKCDSLKNYRERYRILVKAHRRIYLYMREEFDKELGK